MNTRHAERRRWEAAGWQALGTRVRVVVADGERLAVARRLLEADLAAVDAACSRFRPDSELTRLPRDGRPVTVSPLLAEAIAAALRAAALTGGDVDPTVGRALAALGYDRDFARVPPEGPARPVSAALVPGWRSVRLHGRELTLPPGTILDLGATAKAWAADRSAARIAGHLGQGVLVSLGGDIAVAGPAPAGGWTIRVQDVAGDPRQAPEGPYAVVAVRGGGLATSSTAVRRWRRGGSGLHHILDPRTAAPAPAVWRTVSVTAGTCLDANAASTAAVIRGHGAPSWLARQGLAARLVDAGGHVRTIGGWPEDKPPEGDHE
ncbi:MAG TPA: FAD:protein FMN transferase [Trebonia sp.]|jgi:thiamine biosynthesis lipoprotein|nr:FAD:protein FMN transferase [Trebonia sp.]